MLKRSKKASVIIKKVEVERFEVQCPHCKTTLVGGISRDIIKMSCYHCKKTIELIF